MTDVVSASPTVTAFLTEDHVRLAELLAASGRHVAEGRFDEAARCLILFRVGLARHVLMEETVLIPAAEKWTDAVCGLLLVEHRELNEAVEELIGAIEDQDASLFRGVRAELAELFAEHHLKEERTLCPRLDAALPAAERAELVRRMERAPR
jgi:hypothetical protein